jgi:hypothetical protein
LPSCVPVIPRRSGAIIGAFSAPFHPSRFSRFSPCLCSCLGLAGGPEHRLCVWGSFRGSDLQVRH